MQPACAEEGGLGHVWGGHDLDPGLHLVFAQEVLAGAACVVPPS